MEDRYRPCIPKSENEEQQQYLHQLKISEEKSLNGIFGTLILMISKRKQRRMKKEMKNKYLIHKIKNPKQKVQEDILLLS